MIKKNTRNRIASGIVIATIIMLIFKWIGWIEATYWVVFSPLLLLITLLIVVLILSIIIGSIAFIFKRNDTTRKKHLREVSRKAED